MTNLSLSHNKHNGMSDPVKTVTSADVEPAGRVLNDGTAPLNARFRALFTLKHVGGPEALSWITQAFDDPSALLKHELAYCLGQMGDPAAIPVLAGLLADKSRETIVRHEAGEALAALGGPESLKLLREYSQDSVAEVADTCQLGIKMLEYKESEVSRDEEGLLPVNPYASVDPAPPLREKDVSKLKALLLDEKASLFERYRAMFTLRNIGSDDCIMALAEGLKGDNALFRHEVAYVLGQVQSEVAKEQLFDCLRNEAENDMVRHECAEALGSIATDEIKEELKLYLGDSVPSVLRQSCEVALDFCDVKC